MSKKTWLTTIIFVGFCLILGVLWALGLVEKGRIFVTGASQANRLGLEFEQTDRLDEAEKAFRDAISSYSNYPEAYANLARILFKQSQVSFKYAETVKREAVGVTAIVVQGQIKTAWEVGKKRLKEAEEIAKKSAEMVPDDGEVKKLLQEIKDFPLPQLF